eukprot:4308571-Prorocentrum_lima.AAC.1
MTSSLVGSEMCIRDRNNAGACPTASLTTALRVYVAPFGNWSSGGRKCAVSYTHLTLPTIA